MNSENTMLSEINQIKRQLHDFTYIKYLEQPDLYRQQIRGSYGLRGGDKWGVIQWLVSVWGNEKILETYNGDDGYTTL